MSSFHVEVNDPAYPDGTELTVKGFKVLFVNGQAYDISADDTDVDFEGDLETVLHSIAGFTVSQAAPPVGVESPEGAANVTINEVPVEAVPAPIGADTTGAVNEQSGGEN